MISDRSAAVATLVLAVLTACGEASTEPEVTEPEPIDVEMEVVSGNDQSGLSGWPLGQLLSVRVFRDDGSPAAGVPVTFSVTEGGGTTFPRTVAVDDFGLAMSRWTLRSLSVRTQVVTVSVESGGTVRFEATSLRQDEADLVVVHAAPEGPTGFVLVRGTANVEVLAMRATADTLLHLPPQDPGAGLILFGRGNRPERAAPNWTSGVDTAHVWMRPPVSVDFVFHVQAGDFGSRRDTMLEQLDSMQSIWHDEAMGLRVGETTFIDETVPGLEVDGAGSICPGSMPGEVMHVLLVTSINGNVNSGIGCLSGRIGMSIGTDQFPFLLAHEVGHTFTLLHTTGGMMDPGPPGRAVRDGESFRAHFHEASVLNTIFGAQPSQWRRFCGGPPACLPEGLDILDGQLDFPSDRSVAIDSVSRANAGRPSAARPRHRQR